MDLAILIVNWNTRDLLANCLASIYDHPPADKFEVIVVDNNSSDESVEMIKAQFPQVVLIENKENLGFARANNQAADKCNSDFILLLNPDTYAPEESLQNMLYIMQQHPEAGILGPQLLYADGSLQESWGFYPNLRSELFGTRHWRANNDKPRSIIDKHSTLFDVDWVRGACMLITRTAWQEVDGFDEDFIMYTEEVDLCLRVCRAGWQIYHVPSVAIIHFEDQSARKVRLDVLRLYHRSRLYFHWKYCNSGDFFLIRVLTVMKATLNIILGKRSRIMQFNPELNLQQVRQAYLEVIRLAIFWHTDFQAPNSRMPQNDVK